MKLAITLGLLSLALAQVSLADNCSKEKLAYISAIKKDHTVATQRLSIIEDELASSALQSSFKTPSCNHLTTISLEEGYCSAHSCGSYRTFQRFLIVEQVVGLQGITKSILAELSIGRSSENSDNSNFTDLKFKNLTDRVIAQ